MTCECRERVDADLAKHNARVERFFVLGKDKMPWPIATAQIETGRGKKKAPALFASYCPFCGVNLAPPDVDQQHKGGA